MKSYLFDFDGTLVDSMDWWSRKMLAILDKCGTKYPENIIEIITPLGDAGTADYFIRELKVPITKEEMFAQMNAVAVPAYRDEILLKPGVKDYLIRQKANGHSLNILTVSGHNVIEPCLSRNGVLDLFDNIWSTDDFRLTKANPEIYFAAAEKLGVPVSDIVFFDDNSGAVSTAKKAGLFTVAVFDESGKSFNEELKKTADMYIDTFVGLKEI